MLWCDQRLMASKVIKQADSAAAENSSACDQRLMASKVIKLTVLERRLFDFFRDQRLMASKVIKLLLAATPMRCPSFVINA